MAGEPKPPHDGPRRPNFFANCLIAVVTAGGVPLAGVIAFFSVCTMTKDFLPGGKELFPTGGSVAGLAAGITVMVLLYYLYWRRSRKPDDPRPGVERDED